MTTQAKRRQIVVALTAAVAFTALPPSRPASALPNDVPIQPGAPIITREYLGDSYCTLNFVFKDKAKKKPKTYIATAGGCVEGVGARVRSPEMGAFGTVVWKWDWPGAHFALIQIDRNKLKYVSRVVRGFGAAPSGYTTSRTTSPGDPLITHGYPYGAQHAAQGVTRVGVLGDQTSTSYWSSIQPNIQDRGSPVIRADGKAVGMSDEETAFWGTWLPEAAASRYPTIERLLRLLRSYGFNVTL